MPDDRFPIELYWKKKLELLATMRSEAQTEAQRTSQAEEINHILGDTTHVNLPDCNIYSEGATALAEALKKNIDVVKISVTDPDDIGNTARRQISQRLNRNRMLKTFSENLSSSINKDYDIRFERMGRPEAFKRPPLSPKQARVAFEENVIKYLTTPAPGREHNQEQLPELPLEMHINIAAGLPPLLQSTPLPHLKEATLKSRFFKRFNGEQLTADARGAIGQKVGTKEKSFTQAVTERRAQATGQSRQP